MYLDSRTFDLAIFNLLEQKKYWLPMSYSLFFIILYNIFLGRCRMAKRAGGEQKKKAISSLAVPSLNCKSRAMTLAQENPCKIQTRHGEEIKEELAS
jgi:hypothetical protein